MIIRRAEKKDTEAVLNLLHQVLEVHAALRPDLFITGTTKYAAEELHAIFADDTRPVYVATDDDDRVLGYAFCVLEEPNGSVNMTQHRTLYIDDICVDEAARGQHVATRLFEHVRADGGRPCGVPRCEYLQFWQGGSSCRQADMRDSEES